MPVRSRPRAAPSSARSRARTKRGSRRRQAPISSWRRAPRRADTALMLGAQGELMGTRFCASAEALGRDSAKGRLVAAHAEETARTRVFDIVRGYAWPSPYTGRALRNDFMMRWNGREDELGAALDVERVAYRSAVDDDDYATALVWAGEGVDLITSIEPAAALVARIGADAEARLREGASLLR